MTTYKRHELSQIFPDMPEDEVQALADDINANGLHESIFIYQGKVLDGWHRYQACLRVGVNPRTADYRGKNPADFVRSKNAHRRHLTASQRALAIVQLAEWAGTGKPKGDTVSPFATVAKMAEDASTNERTIQRAKTVEVKGSKALKELVRGGEVSVHKAAAVAKFPKREQVAALDAEAEEHGDAGEVDVVAELEHAHAEILKLTAQVESLSKSDVGKEALKWHKMFCELEGRLQQCMATKAEAEQQAKYSSGVLAKLRKMLSVERNSDIERAIMDLRR